MNLFRNMSRKRMIILSVSAIILVVVIIGAAAGTATHRKSKGGNDDKSPQTSSAQSIKAMCSVTEHPDSCFTSISSVEASNFTVDPGMLFQASLEVARDSLEKLSVLPKVWMNQTSDPALRSALEVCDTMFKDATDATNDSISTFYETSDPLSNTTGINNLKTWLSTSLTDLETCLDALEEVNATTLEEVKTAMQNSTEFASNSLAIVTKFLGFVDRFKGRKLLKSDQDSGFPTWLHAADRRLLQAGSPEKANLTVAKDGSGDFTTITAALSKIPKNSKTRFVIYVKAGVYREQVTLDKTMQNVMMYGDGMTETIVVFNSNNVDGARTMLTASFTAAGKGFIAMNMGFKNDAGAIKHQAVALRSASDQSVFHQCSFDAFQDTLYAHNGRQFYSSCDIIGTIDFIFGNAAVVFQSCNIRPRQPMASQFITVTAQGKADPNQNTGTTIQNCNISPLDNVTAPVYLGRPWKIYSTTVFMESYIDGFLQPGGWSEWTEGVTPPSTIFYAESGNTGAGADVSRRVTWAGYRPSLSSSQANKFTVAQFLDGRSWIAAANVQFT